MAEHAMAERRIHDVTPIVYVAEGTVTAIEVAAFYPEFARVTVDHGKGRPNSYLAIPLETARILRVGDPLAVHVY